MESGVEKTVVVFEAFEMPTDYANPAVLVCPDCLMDIVQSDLELLRSTTEHSIHRAECPGESCSFQIFVVWFADPNNATLGQAARICKTFLEDHCPECERTGWGATRRTRVTDEALIIDRSCGHLSCPGKVRELLYLADANSHSRKLDPVTVQLDPHL